ncbi:MAG: hypothetical protein ACFFG0_13705 [Candidatus Thorarchaeota archaeon]
MYFHLRSEIEKKDPEKGYIVKRIHCSTCGKTQIKKVYTNHYFSKYVCWNKNCENKDIPFFLIIDYVQDEDNFDARCESCNQVYYREFIEIDELNCKLIFKCPNDECHESNYELSYDFENKEWIKRNILSDIEFQYLHWYLFRRPSKKELNLLHKFLEEQGFKLIKEDPEREILDYRKFFENQISIHFKISVKTWGFGISCHKDIEIHTKAIFDNQTMKILSMLYLDLKDERSGKCFILPRELSQYRHFLRNKFNPN